MAPPVEVTLSGTIATFLTLEIEARKYEMAGALSITVMLILAALVPPGPVAVTEMAAAPAEVVGEPEIRPVDVFSDNPADNVPEVTA